MRAYIAILFLLFAAATIDVEVGGNWSANDQTYFLLETSVNGTHILFEDNTSRIFDIEECHDLDEEEYFCIDGADNVSARISIEGYERDIDIDIEIESSMEIGEDYQVTASFTNPLPTDASVTLQYITDANVESEGQFSDGVWQGIVKGGDEERAQITIQPINTNRVEIEFVLSGELNASEEARAAVTDRLSTDIDAPSTFSVGTTEEIEITLSSNDNLETDIVITPTQSLTILDATVVDLQDDGTWREDFVINATRTITLTTRLERAVNASLYVDIYTEFEGWEAERRYIEPITWSGYRPLEILSSQMEVAQGMGSVQIRNPNNQQVEADITLYGLGVNISERKLIEASQIVTYDLEVEQGENLFATLFYEDDRSRPLWTNKTIKTKQVQTNPSPEPQELEQEEQAQGNAQVNQSMNESLKEVSPQVQETVNDTYNLAPEPQQEQESPLWLAAIILAIFVGGIIAIARLKASKKEMSEQEKAKYLAMIQSYQPTNQYDHQLKQQILEDLRANK